MLMSIHIIFLGVKKTIVIILLMCFLFNTTGVYTVFYALQYENKERITELISKGIPEEYLTILKIPERIAKENNTLFQRIESNEIRYKDNMYDVVKEEHCNGFVYFYCINDEREDELISSLENCTSNDATSNQLKNKPEIDFLKQLIKNLIKDYRIDYNHYFYFAFFSNPLYSFFRFKIGIGYPFALIVPPWLT
jgi:hypothetical protein